MNIESTNLIAKVAIVGMDCVVNSCDGLDEFERSIYEGIQHFLSGNRLSQEKHSIQKFNQISAPESLTIKIMENSLQDANLKPGTKIGLIVVTETDISLKFASYISTELTFTLTEKSFISALNLAQKLLVSQQVDAVVMAGMYFGGIGSEPISTGVKTLSYDINSHGSFVGEGVAAVVLQLDSTARQEKQRIYAVIDAASTLKSSLFAPEAVNQVCQTAFGLANITAKDIGYVEVFASGVPEEDEAEIQGLISAYTTSSTDLSCGLGSVKASIGNTQAASGIFSLVKTALCLYHFYIPAVPEWTAPKTTAVWSGSPFYVATESKPWFLEDGLSKRIAAINSIESDGRYAHLILSEEPDQPRGENRYLQQMSFHLFFVPAADRISLLEGIVQLKGAIAREDIPLATIASQRWEKFSQSPPATYTMAIVGHNREELTRELALALEGIEVAFNTGKDWQTPLGSYFTAKPQGKHSQIAFVYPGSFTSYLGLGRNYFRLFPQIYDDVVIRSVYERVAKIEKVLYPRTLSKLSKKELEQREQKLISDPVTMLESEAGFAGVITAILQNNFQIQSQHNFGYSLGETSMMLAQGVWKSFKETSDYLNSSPLFKTRISGPKNAVREFWGLPPIKDGEWSEFWSSYILMCPVALVQEAIKQENHVYITLINTEDELLIAGETQACQRLIAKLKCDYFPSWNNHVIHCEPMHSEYQELVKIHNLPLPDNFHSQSIFYSAAEYAPMTLNSQNIGHNIARSLCEHLDFPRLVNRVYADNIKIFIEVGVGSNCSRWISQILKSKDHVVVSLNRRGVDEHTSIIRALAKLLSHGIAADLSPLYTSSVQLENQPVSTSQTIAEKFPIASGYMGNNLLDYQYHHQQKFSANNAYMTKNQAFFLKFRQDSLQKISSLLQKQTDFAKTLLNKSKN